MASNQNPLGNLSLTPQQQSLLFAALNSNKTAGFSNGNTMTLSPANLDGSPVQPNKAVHNFLDNPLIDYDYDFSAADSSFDFTFNDGHNDSMTNGDKPDAPSTTKSDSVSEQDSPDKRSHPDDDDDEEIGAKRREGEDKVSKKPGRKPLTTEPTSVSHDPSRYVFSTWLLTFLCTEAKGSEQSSTACIP
jgi:AP-1-like factor